MFGQSFADCRRATKPGAEPALVVERDVILLVEDDDTIAGLVSHILTRARRRVIRACNGAECIQAFGANAAMIGVVILDCGLPDADGTLLYRELRRRVPDLPVLLTSGRDQSEHASKGPGAMTLFLPKPFRAADVERNVAMLLSAIDSSVPTRGSG